MHTGGTLTSVTDHNNQLASGQHSRAFKKQFESEISEAKKRAKYGQRLTDRQTLLSTLVRKILVVNYYLKFNCNAGVRFEQPQMGRSISARH